MIEIWRQRKFKTTLWETAGDGKGVGLTDESCKEEGGEDGRV